MVSGSSVLQLPVDRKACVLVVVDETDRGRRALEVTLDLARRLEAGVVAQGIVERSVCRGGSWEAPRAAEMRVRVDGALESLRTAGMPAHGEVSIVPRGGAAHAIAELAEDANADLIVLAGARFPRLAAVVGANTADGVEARTARPLLVVPPVRRGRAADPPGGAWRPAPV